MISTEYSEVAPENPEGTCYVTRGTQRSCLLVHAMASTSRLRDSSDESSEDNCTDISDEDTDDYERYLEVKGYQFEPKRKQKNQSGTNELPVHSSETAAAEARPSISRVGRNDWWVILQYL